ncbi:hypothetical protein [Nocardia sp. NPDC050406]|uniref:hypothetical protein n=1 Tax=Nocardia sp. NPDC050406 TaxID=3364318 RepID=UPI0037A00372
MDGHLGNMRTDMERIHLSDFGLVLSPKFELSAAERDFTERHIAYDADYTAMRLVNWIVTDVCGVPKPPNGGPLTRDDYILRNEYVAQCAVGHIPDAVPPPVAAILARHAPAAAKMNAFLWRLFDGDVHAEYPG